MNKKQYIIISFIIFFIGIITFCYFNNWIIINYPNNTNNKKQINLLKANKKEVTLYFWKNSSWKKEKVIIIEKNDKAITLQHLISKWLIVLKEENILDKVVHVQSVLLTQNGYTAYCSFDKNILDKQLCVKQKLYIIKSLIKTIKENINKIQNMYLLVDHKPMQDYHLYFESSWQIY